MRALPLGVVQRRVRLGRVERLVRIELVDEEQEALVRRRLVVEPARRGRHRARARESRPRRGTSRASRRTACARGRSVGAPDPARIGPRLPRVALVAALVVPGGEVDVIVLAADLEEVRMVGDQLASRRPAARRRAVIGSSQISIEPHGRQRKSSAPHRMSWRAGMQGSEPA